MRISNIEFIDDLKNQSSSAFIELEQNVFSTVQGFYEANNTLWPNYLIAIVKGFR